MQNKLTEWVFSIAVKKVTKRAGVLIAALLASPSVAAQLSSAGVTVDQAKLEGFVAVGIFTALEFARNYIKRKVGLKFI